jgi:GNAT superfamily N-acetyltransferase
MDAEREQSSKERGEISLFKPTAENTKDFCNFDWVMESRKPGITITVVEENGEPLGLMATRFSVKDRTDYGALFISLIESVGTDKLGKGGKVKGVGKRLIAHAVKVASRAGVDAVYLQPVTTAVPYYESLGFKPAGSYMVLEGSAFDKMKEE